MKKKTTKSAGSQAKDKLLPKLSLAFFKHSTSAAILWLLIAVFGVFSYTTLLKREGFPSINIPVVIVSGSYAVNDASKVDSTLAEPISAVALKQDKATSVQATSDGNFFQAYVQYQESVKSEEAQKALEQAVKEQVKLPEGAQLQFSAPYFGVTGGDSKKIDATISLYSTDDSASLQQLNAKAEAAVAYLNKQNLSQVEEFFVQSPFESVTDPTSGKELTVQRTFDRYGERDNNESSFYQSVIIGVSGVDGVDVIKLDNQLQAALKDVDAQAEFQDYHLVVSASNAPTINESISELQRVLLEGLLAVLIVGSIVIALRASIITVVSMLTVICATLGLLYLIGYSLNVITLFAVILGLSLIVDDTIIMVEAIDASRKREKTAKKVVAEATRKISRAMVAATLTAALSFAPLLFVSGILGSFIRAIPVTIISALLISLFVALAFIPLFSRFLLLGKNQLGEKNVREVAAGVEHNIATWLGKPMLWAQHHRKREFGVGISAVLIGLTFVMAAGFIFSKVTFNIFPSTKDTNQIAVQLTYAPGQTVQQATAIAEKADKITADTLDQYFENASYYGLGSAQMATLYVNLTPYGERGPSSHDLIAQLDKAFANFNAAKVDIYQLDVGPPTAGFTVNVNATNRQEAVKLADDIAAFLQGHKLTRVSGEVATITDAQVSNTDIYKRVDNKPVISVVAQFDGTDTTTLTTLAQDAVKQEFDADKLAAYGMQTSDVTFDLGQEQENQDSFKTLALAFPILLFVIYLLLAVQFRSLLQPLLIFMALPFSLFGVTLGLYLTDNAFSFFAMLGFFALIGLSIKNTILLTDYANQARRAGMSPVDAAVEALGERFRPLIATSLTAIFSLIPLAVTSPFWQGLAVVLIFGLASSTFLVLTVFPYYYLGAEYLRNRISRKMFGKWFAFNAVLVAVFAVLNQPKLILPGLVAFNLAWWLANYSKRKKIV
ncbi:efflux RND transporter permease subunit [Candidatus Saccharibacteria bacterium]|nr:efflux RND transporter permease subunit [Candidatus Saccharibacteria bacterium]